MVVRIFWNLAAGVMDHPTTTTQPGLGINYPCVWRSRVGLSECDMNMHMNNASYLSAMDYARWHFAGALGLVPVFLARGMSLLGGSQTIRYRHAIPPLAEYEIHSEFVHWDDKWFFLLQRVVCPHTGKLFAEGLIRGAVRRGREFVPMREVYREVTGLDFALSDKPEIVQGFLAWDAATKDHMEATSNLPIMDASPAKKKKKKTQSKISSSVQTAMAALGLLVLVLALVVVGRSSVDPQIVGVV